MVQCHFGGNVTVTPFLRRRGRMNYAIGLTGKCSKKYSFKRRRLIKNSAIVRLFKSEGLLTARVLIYQIFVFKNRDVFTIITHDCFSRNEQSIIANKVHLSVWKNLIFFFWSQSLFRATSHEWNTRQTTFLMKSKILGSLYDCVVLTFIVKGS